MIVRATEIKNNLGKYLKLLDTEEILITRNGLPVARLTKHEVWDQANPIQDPSERVFEQAEAYKYPGSYHGRKMTYEEYMEMRENTEDRYEYIDGVAFYISSPTITHQAVLGNLYTIFRLWFRGKKCMPYLSPFDVTLKKSEKNINVAQPDLLLICDPENINEKDRYTGTPSLVVEILSESTHRADLVRKLDLYMQTGIQEYWVVNYLHKEVVVYRFTDLSIVDMRAYTGGSAVMSFIFEGLEAALEEVFA